MEFPVYSQSKNGKKLKRIINHSDRIAIIPSNHLKKYKFETEEVNLFEKVSELILAESVFSWDFPYSEKLARVPREGIAEDYFEPGLYDTHFQIELGSLQSKCTAQVMTNIVCETAASMSVFLKLPPPKRE
ncbi:hypothetical protein [Leptospira interrogans]|nr:hypothetical protein [Leptospira interrogans]UMQ60634.1 hypothetical protein FH585_21760 [Leptospira interrogans]